MLVVTAGGEILSAVFKSLRQWGGGAYWKSQHSKSLLAVLGVERLQLSILRCETTLTGQVDNQGHFALVLVQLHCAAVNVLNKTETEQAAEAHTHKTRTILITCSVHNVIIGVEIASVQHKYN
jgi:hypothetical protein